METYDNYSAVVVEITNKYPLFGLDRLVGTRIMGQQVLVGADTPIGTVGLYFPIETSIAPDFLRANNLYTHADMNADPTKTGFFEASGRVKAVKFRTHRSEGYFIPLQSLDYFGLPEMPKVGDDFNTIGGQLICQKYVKPTQQQQHTPKPPIALPAIDGVPTVKLHYNTNPFYKITLPVNVHVVITEKLHGTSGVCGRVYIGDGEYQPLVTSRKELRNPNGDDVWGHAARVVLPLIEEGITLYYEIVGYEPGGGMIQPKYDYGYDMPKGNYQYGKNFGVYVYRVTKIDPETLEIREYSASEVQSYCVERGLTPVPHLFTGQLSHFGNTFEEAMEGLKAEYLEQRCDMCKNNVPNEGIVVRVAELPDTAFKLKSFAFLVYETKALDRGEIKEEV